MCRCVQGDQVGEMSCAQVSAGVYKGTVQVKCQVHRCVEVCTDLREGRKEHIGD